MRNADIDSREDSCIEAQKRLITKQGRSAKTTIRSACSECKRRKQKCVRSWPCLHCNNRRSSAKCIFPTPLDVKPIKERRAHFKHLLAKKKDFGCIVNDLLGTPCDDSDDSDIGRHLEGLGYSAAHIASNLSRRRKTQDYPTPDSKKYSCSLQTSDHSTPGSDISSCSLHLEKAIQALPPRSCLDALMDNFLDFVNFHCRIINPVILRQEYQKWCYRVDNNDHSEPEWTALLLLVCYCSAQYPSGGLRRILEADQQHPIDDLPEKYHALGHELASMIPIRKHDLDTIKDFLFSSHWAKSEAIYLEDWHDLTVTAQTAHELGINYEEIALPPPDQFLEMRRNVWAAVCTWDWQLDSIISHPFISQADLCNIKPSGFFLNGELEEVDHSACLLASLQFELGNLLLRPFDRPGSPTQADIADYMNVIESWVSRLPHCLSLRNPDTSLDGHYRSLRLQRLNLTTIGILLRLIPLRSYLMKPLSTHSPPDDLRLQRDGILWALRHLSRLFQLLRFASPKHTGYSTVLFFIFDAALLLCSAVVNDIDSSMPLREPVRLGIDRSLGMMKALESYLPIAKQMYRLFSRVYDQNFRQPADNMQAIERRMQDPLHMAENRHGQRVGYLVEQDAFWDVYDFSFTVTDEHRSLEPPVSTANSAGVIEPTDAVVPPETLSNGVSAALNMSHDDDGNEGFTEMLSSCTDFFNFDDLPAVDTALSPFKPQTQEPLPVMMEDSVNCTALSSPQETDDFDIFSKYINTSP